MSAESEVIVRRYFEEIWNQRKLAVIDELVGASHVNHDPSNPGLKSGPAGLRDLVQKYTTAFPDTHFTIEDIISVGDRVAVRWSVRGTHKGDLEGIAPTGKAVGLTGISINRIADGKVVETWNNWDALGMMQQLGVLTRSKTA